MYSALKTCRAVLVKSIARNPELSGPPAFYSVKIPKLKLTLIASAGAISAR